MSVKTVIVKPKCEVSSDRPKADYITCKAKESIGKWIIIGTPKEPSEIWKCGTDVIFPVLDAEFFTRKPKPSEYRYVCRHMIAIGD